MSRCEQADLDEATARRLCDLTSEFYRANAESFSQTRQAPWQGWERALAAAGIVAADAAEGVAAAGEVAAGVAAADADADAVDPFPGSPVGASEGSRTAVRASGVANALPPMSSVGAAAASSRPAASPLRVLDLACGNLRFERFLAERLGAGRLRCFAVDNCDPLVDQAQTPGVLPPVSFQNLDVVDALAAGNLREALAVPDTSCDLAATFGFMHHVPREAWRAELLRALAAKVRPGGRVVVSFWRFLNSEKLAKKALATTEQARVELDLPALPLNDFLLGWQDTRGLYRYCHHFDEPEIERLMAAVADVARPVARFAADGKTGNLNEYVILRVRKPASSVVADACCRQGLCDCKDRNTGRAKYRLGSM